MCKNLELSSEELLEETTVARVVVATHNNTTSPENDSLKTNIQQQLQPQRVESSKPTGETDAVHMRKMKALLMFEQGMNERRQRLRHAGIALYGGGGGKTQQQREHPAENLNLDAPQSQQQSNRTAAPLLVLTANKQSPVVVRAQSNINLLNKNSNTSARGVPPVRRKVPSLGSALFSRNKSLPTIDESSEEAQQAEKDRAARDKLSDVSSARTESLPSSLRGSPHSVLSTSERISKNTLSVEEELERFCFSAPCSPKDSDYFETEQGNEVFECDQAAPLFYSPSSSSSSSYPPSLSSTNNHHNTNCILNDDACFPEIRVSEEESV